MNIEHKINFSTPNACFLLLLLSILLLSGLVRSVASVANGNPLEVAYAFRRVRILPFGPEQIF